MAIHLTEEARQDVTIGKGTIYLDSDTGELNVAGRTTPHIIPGVLYPAVSGNDLSGTALGGSYVYGTAHTDGRKYYYTDIKGSKPIKDPRIGGHFGSQRHKFKSLQLLEQETATHGSNVYSIDGREWVRCYDVSGDGFSARYDGIGTLIQIPNCENDVIEITGYFNDLNIIAYTSASTPNNISVTIDGTSNVTGFSGLRTSVSTPIRDRYVDAGSVINLGLNSVSLGIHTAKILLADSDGGDQFLGYGIELIAQDTSNRNNIQIPSQDVVSYGKKFTVSAEGSSGHHYNPFNGYTATTSFSSVVDVDTSLGLEAWKHTDNNYYPPVNGGRIVKWVDSSGTIKTSVTLMPPNATGIGSFSSNPRDPNYGSWSSQYQPTFKNETERQLHEVAKTFKNREFGNGSANGNSDYLDASVIAGGSNNIAYVMDDGLTSLSAYGVTGGSSSGTKDRLNMGSGDYAYITFIGTGITFDGTVWADNAMTTHQVAQNLPYGTHILKIFNNSLDIEFHVDGVKVFDNTQGPGHTIADITFFQPKRPPIPEDACVIADYMLMADFVAQTSVGIDNISKGTRLVSTSRDIFYDESGSDSFNFNLNTSRLTGFTISLSSPSGGATDNTKYRLPVFGTNIVARGYDPSNRLAGIFVNDTTPAGTSSGTAEASTVGSGTTAVGDFKYLTTSKDLGVYTFGVNAGNGTNGDFEGFQIATPIHTSSHYQTFETPFLHELVGGDRNMEQTNLVVSPDGKTWDQITRDTSYLSNVSIVASRDGGDFTSAQSYKYDLFRGTFHVHEGTQKNFAIAYDRFICLVDGYYKVTTNNYTADQDRQIHVMKNSVSDNNSKAIAFGRSDPGDNTIALTGNVHLKRGDYIGVYVSGGTIRGSNVVYTFISIEKLY